MISYWILPVFSAIAWLVTILTLLLYWIAHDHRSRYASMDPAVDIAYISDIGADTLKPLFIVGAILTAVPLDLAILCDRWLRHRGRLVPNASRGEKVLAGLSVFFALIGAVGLILLSGFDTARYPQTHYTLLVVFLVGYLLAALFICWEYQRLGKKNRNHPLLVVSFWIKLGFFLVILGLSIVFTVTTFQFASTVGAILEWIIAFLFAIYIFSFALDLWPAIHTRDFRTRLPRDSSAEPLSPAVEVAALGGSSLPLPPRPPPSSSSTIRNDARDDARDDAVVDMYSPANL